MTEQTKNFGEIADDIIAREVAGQDAMWGRSNERADSTKGQLLLAGLATLTTLWCRRETGDASVFDRAPACYPEGWSGFRDYGSDVANLAVAAAYIRQEIKRLVSIGADVTRKSREVKTQPYTGDQPAVQI